MSALCHKRTLRQADADLVVHIARYSLMSRLASPSLAFADYRFFSAAVCGQVCGLDPGLANKASFRPSVGGGKLRQSLC